MIFAHFGFGATIINMEKVVLLAVILAVFLHSYYALEERRNVLESDQALDMNVIMQQNGEESAIDNVIMQQNGEESAITKRANQAECNKNLQFPEAPNIATIDANKIINYWEASASIKDCLPHPFPVRIPAPSHLNIYPTQVQLRRCYGRTHSFVQECAVTKKEKVHVQYLDANTGLSYSAIMYDHIECKLGCFQRCNPKTQILNAKCECKCKYNDTHCDNMSPDRYLDKHKCACVCKAIQKCGVYREWDPVKCVCSCAKCIKDMCIKANLKLDQKVCRCVNV